MLQGQLLTYDPATGNGIVAANGERIAFEIHRWRADTAPQVGAGVEVHVLPDGAREFRPTPVSLSPTAAANYPQSVGNSVKEKFLEACRRIGWPLLVAHLGFLWAILKIPVVQMDLGIMTINQSLWGIWSNASFGLWELIFACLSPLVVVFGTGRIWQAIASLPAIISVQMLYEMTQITAEFESMKEAITSPDANPLEQLALIGLNGIKSMNPDWEGGLLVALAGISLSSIAWRRIKR